MSETVVAEKSALEAVVMLYDGVLVRIANAAKAASEGNAEAQAGEVTKAVQIVNGLNRCLDMEEGGTVAQSLREMYESVVKALIGTLGRGVQPEVYKKIAEAVWNTREAWAEIADVPPLDPAQAV